MAFDTEEAHEALRPQTVYVVDDDAEVAVSLTDFLEAAGLSAKSYGDAASFFASAALDAAGCVLVDLHMPKVDGIGFQRELDGRGYRLPVVFMTGLADVGITVAAMKAGAIDFFQKPFRPDDLLKSVLDALTLDAGLFKERQIKADALSKFSSLTPREKEVMSHVVRGLLNKQIAYELGISEIMVKLHRSSMMKKMNAASLPELVRLAAILP
ncbi:response regulator [Rhizobium sp. Root1220]|uniref:response regulator transcription factor n=1 Tax=Rhizobium sp. Root1220 TaxID=1736432 RepID=UPI0006F7FC49|nr:response regulator [Rhizobium sp. Root1220]KQV73253.1 hypothetical protein ASC90_07600 [Rhizobium sp. Root1220]